MKPAKERIPYTHRPATVAQFCTCTYRWDRDTPSEPPRLTIITPDPRCKLHGPRAERSPY